LLAGVDQRVADAVPALRRLDAELVQMRHVAPKVPGAVARARHALHVPGAADRDRADDQAVLLGDEALAAGDALGRDLRALVHRGVVQPHRAQAGVGAMQQRRQRVERIGRLQRAQCERHHCLQPRKPRRSSKAS
jgi:hypothetical protein